MADIDRSNQTAPTTNAGLPDLPPYEVMAKQLQQNGGMTQGELHELFWKQNHPEREERLQDIIDQDYDYVPTFLHHLGIDPHQHSKTLRLIETPGFLDATVVMPWKLKWNRSGNLIRK